MIIPLWPEGVPSACRAGSPAAKGSLLPEETDATGSIEHVSTPTLTLIRPAIDRPNGTAVIICPGGGYMRLSANREGLQYATWLSTLGVTSFVLKNRLSDYGHPAPLQDVLRAIRLVRSRAKEFGLDPNRLGAMGSSAGGHLSASAGTLFDAPEGKTGAPLDAVSGRPDFLLLMYPVITLENPVAHAGSRIALVGENAPAELVRQLSLENRVTSRTPPTLLIHTQEDQTVPVENSIRLYQALTRAKVPAEMHLFERGAHGMDMIAGLGTSSDWPARAAEWLRARDLLEPPK